MADSACVDKTDTACPCPLGALSLEARRLWQITSQIKVCFHTFLKGALQDKSVRRAENREAGSLLGWQGGLLFGHEFEAEKQRMTRCLFG